MLLLLRRLLTVVYLMTHRAVPLHLKALPVLALVYLLFPRDLWFDFRAFGLIDDLIVGGLLIGTFTTKGWNHVLSAERKRDDTIPAEFRVVNGDDAPSEDAPSATGDPHDADGAPTSDLRG